MKRRKYKRKRKILKPNKQKEFSLIKAFDHKPLKLKLGKQASYQRKH